MIEHIDKFNQYREKVNFFQASAALSERLDPTMGVAEMSSNHANVW
jgi:hypothetical protein